MKVVFLQEVEGTARVGEVKTVKDGFARNYLIPRGIALPPTKDVLARAQALADREERKQRKLDEEAAKVVDRIGGRKVTILARVGEQGRLYGSVTSGDIAEELEKLTGQPVDRHTIQLAEPLRELGDHEVALRLTRNVSTSVTVSVLAEGSEEAEEATKGAVVVERVTKGKKKAQAAEEAPQAQAEESDSAEDGEVEPPAEEEPIDE